MTTITLPAHFVPCTDECMYAKGDDCECHCEGRNHRVGTAGLIPDFLAEITRTRAGRRITPLIPGDAHYDTAVLFRALHEEGMTKRENAAAFDVSGPTVRRYITRLDLAEEMVYDLVDQVA